MKEFFFFYGTLRKGCSISNIVLRSAKYVMTITMKGELYLTEDRYPVYVPNDKGVVVGDIFEVPVSLIEKLDDYEEVNLPDSPYERKKFNKNNMDFWVYVAKNDFLNRYLGLKKIVSGDWLQFSKRNRFYNNYRFSYL